MARKIGCSRQDDERALSEVIGFVLLLGLIIAAFSLWMIYVVPANGREEEIDQMNVVKDRFTEYKISLDSLWVNNQSGVTLSTSVDLGTGGGNTQSSGLFLPLLKPIASSAVMSVKDQGDTLTINTSSSGNFTYPINILEYQSQNNYWIQQRYYYQTGGVFLSQENGSTCRVSPPFSFIKATTGSVDAVSITLVPLQVLGGGSIGGNGPVRVDSTIKTLGTPLVLKQNDWVRVTVNTTDRNTAQVWGGVFNETLIRGSITNGSWYTSPVVTENPITKRGTVTLLINGPRFGANDPDVYLTLRNAEYKVYLNNVGAGLT